jgi:hypothetical protein
MIEEFNNINVYFTVCFFIHFEMAKGVVSKMSAKHLSFLLIIYHNGPYQTIHKYIRLFDFILSRPLAILIRYSVA